MTPDQPPPPPAAYVAKAEVRAEARAPSSLQRWTLLDPFTARHSGGFAFELASFRPESQRVASTGYGISLGESLTTVRGAWAAGALQEHELRLVPDDSISLILSRYQWEAGPVIGPLEPRVRVGFALLHLDAGDNGVSFGLLTPRVGARVWLKLSRARIGFSVFAEYFWRLVGDEHAWVRGLTLEFQPELPPLRRPRATSSPAAPARR